MLEYLESGDRGETADADTSDLQTQLRDLLAPLATRHDLSPDEMSATFINEWFPKILDASREDYDRYPVQDPALSNAAEVLYASNGFWATVSYRVANALRLMKVPIIPRAISGFAHSRTGVDIHPSATIAPGLFIDHGTGIAIGCTAVLERNVNLYNGVVLGTRSKPSKKTNDNSGEVVKRHPTIAPLFDGPSSEYAREPGLMFHI